jgi:hypothetical protein
LISLLGGRDLGMRTTHVYEVRPRKDRRGFDLISDALPFGRLWYRGKDAINNAIGYAKLYSRSHDAVIRVYDEAGNVIETHEHDALTGRSSRLLKTRAPKGRETVSLSENTPGQSAISWK